MNRKMVGQILDKRAFMIYFAAWLLLFTVAPGPKSTMNLSGRVFSAGKPRLEYFGDCTLESLCAASCFGQYTFLWT